MDLEKEIEQLCYDNNRLIEASADLATELAQVQARIGELEEALRKIQQRCNESGPGELGERETIYSVHDIACQALSREGGSDG